MKPIIEHDFQSGPPLRGIHQRTERDAVVVTDEPDQHHDESELPGEAESTD